MNADERIAELEARHVEERRKLDREIGLIRLLPAAILELDVMAHPHKLYDRVGSVHLNYQRYESIRKGRQPKLEDLIALAREFTPIPLAVYRDGCVSIRTFDDAERELEKAQARMAEGHETGASITPIAPFWLNFDAASHSQEMAIHFIGQTALGPVEFKAEFPLSGEPARKIGAVHVTYKLGSGRHERNLDTRQIERTDLELTPACHVLGNARGEVIRYSSGNSSTPGNRLLYYDSANGQHPTTTLEDLARAVA